MKFGLAPTQSEGTINVMLRQAALAEDLGFDTLWAQEHHSMGMMYPSPLITLTALAGCTKTVGLGTNMLLLPLYHPVRVAEEAAMVDMFSGGRLRLGVSAGYSETDFLAQGVDLHDRARRMREGVVLIRRLWTEETVSAKSRDYELEGFKLFPKPLQQPSPPIYMGGTVPAAIERAARLGDEFLISATQNLAQIETQISIYHEAIRSLGLDPGQKSIAINRVVHVAANRRAKQAAADAFAQQFLLYYKSWGHQTITNLDGRSLSLEDVVAQHFIVGEPAECIDKVAAFAALGIQHICCFMEFGKTDLDLAEASLRRFGEGVLPHCDGSS